jgi:hypothetical protein
MSLFALAWLIVALSSGLLFGAGVGIQRWRARDRRRLLSAGRAIARLEAGPVRVVGRVVAGEVPLTAPITGRPCVAWDLRIEARGDGGWSSLVDERQAADFFVEDDSGRALVSVSSPRLSLAAEERFASGGPGLDHDDGEAEARLAIFLASRGHGAVALDGLDLRFREGVLASGEVVIVGGVARREPAPSSPVSSLVISRAAGAELVIADDPALVDAPALSARR